jgi:hypothetical protein
MASTRTVGQEKLILFFVIADLHCSAAAAGGPAAPTAAVMLIGLEGEDG